MIFCEVSSRNGEILFLVVRRSHVIQHTRSKGDLLSGTRENSRYKDGFQRSPFGSEKDCT